MNIIAFFNFIQGLIILFNSILALFNNTPIIWAGKHFNSYYNLLGLLMGGLLLISSLGIFIGKNFGSVLTLLTCLIIIVYGIFTIFYGNPYLVNYYSSIPFAILTQLIVILFIGKHADIKKDELFY